MSTIRITRSLRGALAGTLVVAVGAALPATLASAAQKAKAHHGTTVSGVVIARNAARHTIALSNKSHAVVTLRLASAGATNHVALGSRVMAKGAKLGDGTMHVNTMRHYGLVRRAMVRATVVRTSANTLTMSAGGTTFNVVTTGRQAHSSHSAPAVGDVENVSVEISASGLDATSLQQVGTTNLVQLDGVISSVSATSIVIAADQGAVTTIAIPSSLTLPPTIVVGNQVEALVDVSGGTFTLVTVTDFAQAGSAGLSGVSSNEDGQSGNVQVEGLVVASSATSITVQAGDGTSPVVIAVPSTINVSTLSVGSRVHARATMVNGVLTLVSLQQQNSQGESGDHGNNGQSMMTEVEGIVASVSSTSIVITTGDHATPVTLSVPSTIDVSNVVVGARVHARGEIVNGTLTLTSIMVQGTEDGGGSSATSSVEGAITAVSATSLTIAPSNGSAAVTLAVPSTVNVSTLQVGETIDATTTMVNGVDTLVSFQVTSSATSSVEGAITAVSATSLTIAPSNGSAAVTLAVPSTVNVSTLQVGETIDATTTMVNGVDTLVSFETSSSTTQTFTGTVSAVSSTSLTIAPSNGSAAMTFAVPSTVSVANVTVGENVNVVTQLVNGVVTVVSISAVS